MVWERERGARAGLTSAAAERVHLLPQCPLEHQHVGVGEHLKAAVAQGRSSAGVPTNRSERRMVPAADLDQAVDRRQVGGVVEPAGTPSDSDRSNCPSHTTSTPGTEAIASALSMPAVDSIWAMTRFSRFDRSASAPGPSASSSLWSTPNPAPPERRVLGRRDQPLGVRPRLDHRRHDAARPASSAGAISAYSARTHG